MAVVGAERPDQGASDSRGDRSDRGVTSTFASLAVLPYRRLFIAGLIVFLAVQSQVIARGWLANELTGTNTGLGGVYMAFGVPMLLATPFGGVIADRVSKRLVMALCQLAFAASSAWIGLGVAFEFVEYWMLLATSAVQAVAFAFYGPARMAMAGQLVGRALLPNAIVLGQMSMNSTRVVGPAIAGVAIGITWIGTAGVYFMSTALSLLAFAVTSRLPPGHSATLDPRSPAKEFIGGLAYVRAHRDIALLIVTSFLVVMIGFPYIAFLPRLADSTFDHGAAGYGALSAMSAVGAVSMSLFIARRAGSSRARLIQTVSGFAFGAGLVLLAAAPTFVAAMGVVLLVGAANAGFQSMNNSLVLALSDFEYHGRIQSLMMLSFSGFGMAALPLGATADAVGLRPTLAAMGVLTILCMLAYWLVRRPRLRQRLEAAFG
jgi:MFS family permease